MTKMELVIVTWVSYTYNPKLKDTFFHQRIQGVNQTVSPKLLLMDEIRLATWAWQFITFFTGFFTSQVVQDFFHQQYQAVQDFWNVNSFDEIIK